MINRSLFFKHTKLKEMGYEVEIHLVDTEDGYTLALERVPHPKFNKTVGDPVLLLHGLFSNSLVFALNYTSLGKPLKLDKRIIT